MVPERATIRPPTPWRVGACALAVAALLPGGSAASETGAECVPDEPADYRLADFRAPTPCTLAGGRVLAADGLARLVRAGPPVLVDVFPAPRRPAGLTGDGAWLPPARASIPGSVWLPNTGFGILPAEEERYLRDNLLRLTQGDPARALVFFCERDCWMSWNAARRAVEWGYTGVYWYPGGTDDWQASGRPLRPLVPVPRDEGH